MEWDAGDDYCIRFSDETGEDRTKVELDGMVDEMRAVANKYGFDVSSWGSWESMRRVAVGEGDILDKHLVPS